MQSTDPDMYPAFTEYGAHAPSSAEYRSRISKRANRSALSLSGNLGHGRLPLQPRQGTEAESTDRIRFRISISHHIDHTECFVLWFIFCFFFGLGFKLGWIFVRVSQRVGRVALPLLVLWLAGPPCRTMQARSDRYNNAGGSRYASVLLWRYCNSTFYICVCVCVEAINKDAKMGLIFSV